MAALTPTSTRLLDRDDVPVAWSLTERAGVHGVYVRNEIGEPGGPEPSDLLGFFDSGVLCGVAYFGRRGNLIVIEDVPLQPVPVARAILDSQKPWRIALGSAGVLEAIADREPLVPIVHRTQVYYGVHRGESVPPSPDVEVRPASRHDVRALVEAALELNSSDLNVQPWRVNKGWLKDSVKRRVRQGHTFTIGPEGEPWCKLDVGSLGDAGVMLEGVYTVPAQRGRGLARGLVSNVTATFLERCPLVCLHVAAANGSARRAYEKAGMRELGECRLLLRG